jgi:hypothetical protein
MRLRKRQHQGSENVCSHRFRSEFNVHCRPRCRCQRIADQAPLSSDAGNSGAMRSPPCVRTWRDTIIIAQAQGCTFRTLHPRRVVLRTQCAGDIIGQSGGASAHDGGLHREHGSPRSQRLNSAPPRVDCRHSDRWLLTRTKSALTDPRFGTCPPDLHCVLRGRLIVEWAPKWLRTMFMRPVRVSDPPTRACWTTHWRVSSKTRGRSLAAMQAGAADHPATSRGNDDEHPPKLVSCDMAF